MTEWNLDEIYDGPELSDENPGDFTFRGVPVPWEYVDVPGIEEAATWRRGVIDALDYIEKKEKGS